jgi:FkbM family methyltransferase
MSTLYENGLFVEAIPSLFEKLSNNLSEYNKKHNTKFKPINKLVTSEEGKEYVFYVLRRDGQSSSIYAPNGRHFFRSVPNRPKEKLKLTSSKISTILREEEWCDFKFDLVIDAQGAELEVLKGFGGYLKNIEKMHIEVTRDVPIYKGGVLFPELHKWLYNNNFKIDSSLLQDGEVSMSKIPWHGNVMYYKNKT